MCHRKIIINTVLSTQFKMFMNYIDIELQKSFGVFISDIL